MNLRGLPSNERRYIFLGNYTGLGQFIDMLSILLALHLKILGFASHESLLMVLALKMLLPTSVFLLRGNHEDADILHVPSIILACVSSYSFRPTISRPG